MTGCRLGVELLGKPFGEATLLRLAHSYETSTHPRRTPDSTPALVNGRAPAVRTFTVEAGAAKVSFTFDRLSSSGNATRPTDAAAWIAPFSMFSM